MNKLGLILMMVFGTVSAEAAVVCTTSSNGFHFRLSARDFYSGRTGIINVCTRHPRTEAFECRSNSACREAGGYDPYPPNPYPPNPYPPNPYPGYPGGSERDYLLSLPDSLLINEGIQGIGRCVVQDSTYNYSNACDYYIRVNGRGYPDSYGTGCVVGYNDNYRGYGTRENTARILRSAISRGDCGIY